VSHKKVVRSAKKKNVVPITMHLISATPIKQTTLQASGHSNLLKQGKFCPEAEEHQQTMYPKWEASQSSAMVRVSRYML